MSRIPPIDRRALREPDEKLPAEKERIERVWSRVREDLPVPISNMAQDGATVVPVVKPRRSAFFRGPARAAMLFAAAGAMVGFAAGIVVMSSGVDEDKRLPIVVQPTQDATMTDVFAAGLRQRSFSLPGGGFLVLEPDSLVEVVSVSDELVRLSLLRGATSVDPGTIGVEVIAGEARISAPAGASVALARRESDLDVHVGQGAVAVSWPAGNRVVRGGQVLSHVPTVTIVTASEEPPPSVPEPTLATAPPAPTAVASVAQAPSPPGPLVAVDPPAPVVAPSDASAPSWVSLARSNKTKEALDLIERGAGLSATIKSAQSAQELMLLWEVATIAKRFELQVQALERVVSEFGSGPNAYIAAMYLADIYDGKDKALAAKYREKAVGMKYLTEVTLCEQVRAAANDVDAVDAKWAAQKANEYLQSYPTTSCAEDARSLLEELAPRLAAEKKAMKKSDGEQPPSDTPPGEPSTEKKNEGDSTTPGGTKSKSDDSKSDGSKSDAPKAPPGASGSAKPAPVPSAGPAPSGSAPPSGAPTPKAAYPTAP